MDVPDETGGRNSFKNSRRVPVGIPEEMMELFLKKFLEEYLKKFLDVLMKKKILDVFWSNF